MQEIPSLIQELGQFALLAIGVGCVWIFLISIVDSQPLPRDLNLKQPTRNEPE